MSNTSSEGAEKLAGVVSRVGSLAEIACLSAAEVAAIGASMTGVTEEISATGVKNLMKAMNAGSAATTKQQAVLDKLGFSASAMAERMQTDAQGAIMDLLGAFRQLPEAEQSAALTQYFGAEKRLCCGAELETVFGGVLMFWESKRIPAWSILFEMVKLFHY